MTCQFREHGTSTYYHIASIRSSPVQVHGLIMETAFSSLALDDAPRRFFHFAGLPSELRHKVLGMVLRTEKTIDLDPLNYSSSQKRLNLFLVSRAMHKEASYAYYAGHTFRILPTHVRFFGNRSVPLLARLSSQYRASLVSLELRLGPGWGKPPKSWRVDDGLGLEEMTSVRRLKVFVEVDPSQDVFQGFRVGEDFYTRFSETLLNQIMERLPVLARVEFDGYPSVMSGRGILMQTLIRLAQSAGMRVSVSNKYQWPHEVGRNCCVNGMNDGWGSDLSSLCIVR